jgi:hypothetical protein
VENVLAELEIRCTGCRDGLAGADEWSAWYARADEIEAAHLAEHGNLDDLDASEDWQILVEERPESPEEIQCVTCAGTGIVLTDAGREVLRWAEARLTRSAA